MGSLQKKVYKCQRVSFKVHLCQLPHQNIQLTYQDTPPQREPFVKKVSSSKARRQETDTDER